MWWFWGLGVIPYKRIDITDFWADYEPISDVSNPGLIISNHTSYLDMWMFLLIKENPAFLSKFSVQNMPLVNQFAFMHQVIFFKRGDKSVNMMEVIEKRVIEAEQGKYSPLLIFPEGTTTNGRGMMKFKRGAFQMEKPFYVYSLMYNSPFVPCLNMIKVLPSIFLVLSQISNGMVYCRLNQPIDPMYILKKYGRKPGQEGNWEIIAKETKELMCFAFGLEDDSMSFVEKCEFDCQTQGISMDELKGRA